MVDKFHGFHGSIRDCKIFPVKYVACVIDFGYTRLMSNRKSFPANYSLILNTAKVFHLEQFATYGISSLNNNSINATRVSLNHLNLHVIA